MHKHDRTKYFIDKNAQSDIIDKAVLEARKKRDQKLKKKLQVFENSIQDDDNPFDDF